MFHDRNLNDIIILLPIFIILTTCSISVFYYHFLCNMLSCTSVFYYLRWVITHGNIIKIGYYCECQDMYGGFPWNNGWPDNGRTDAAGDDAARACYCIHMRCEPGDTCDTKPSDQLYWSSRETRLAFGYARSKWEHSIFVQPATIVYNLTE